MLGENGGNKYLLVFTFVLDVVKWSLVIHVKRILQEKKTLIKGTQCIKSTSSTF